MLIVAICVFILLLKDSETRIYEPCRLAKELYYVYGISLEDIPLWLCAIDHRSAYNTSLIRPTETANIQSHGLFQFDEFSIDRKFGCSYRNSKDLSHATEVLELSAMSDDNISDDVKCILNNMRRLGYTISEWFGVCKHIDPSVLLHGCNI